MLKTQIDPRLSLAPMVPAPSADIHIRGRARGPGLLQAGFLLAFALASSLTTIAVIEILRPISVPVHGWRSPASQPDLARNTRTAETLPLLRTTFQMLSDAVRSNDYTAFRFSAAPSFRDHNDEARLAKIFDWLRRRNVDLGAAQRLTAASLSEVKRAPHGFLQVKGRMASTVGPLDFHLAFQNLHGRWSLFAIRLAARQ
jgi:hypothetical protein